MPTTRATISIAAFFCTVHATAMQTINVNSSAGLSAELVDGLSDTEIVLAPGLYDDVNLLRTGLTNVIIRGENPASRPTLRGGASSDSVLQFETARGLTLMNFDVEAGASTGNLISIDDDDDWPGQKSFDVRITQLNLIGSRGLGAIKLAGTEDVVIDTVVVDGFEIGAGIDAVGVHDALVKNSFFRSSATAATSVTPDAAITFKGGSSDVKVVANRVEVTPDLPQRGIRGGGYTSPGKFRFDNDTGPNVIDPPYEVDGFAATGNVVVGGWSVAYEDALDTRFANNLIQDSFGYPIFLSDSPSSDAVPGGGLSFTDNTVVLGPFLDAMNVSDDGAPEPEEMAFSGNTWFSTSVALDENPTAALSQLGLTNLGVTESNGAYGVDPGMDANDVQVWSFGSFTWLVNARRDDAEFPLAGRDADWVGRPGSERAYFDVFAVDGDPFVGTWSFLPLQDAESIDLDLLSDAVLIRTSISGDFNNSGQVEQGDLDLVLQNWGIDSTSNIPGGWVNDFPVGQIEQTELDKVLANWGAASAATFVNGDVPEPSAVGVLLAANALPWRRTGSRNRGSSLRVR